ncbi:MAG TPA: hypothetical protein VGH81_14410 [Rudaea sp.]|jgi:hypothetical protein
MTKRGILRAGLWALAVVVLFVGAAGGFALYFHHKFSPDPPSNDFPRPANALEAQQQDIEQFSRLLAMDRAFTPAARAEADRQIAELKSEHVPLDRERFHVALLRITALADNGHTNLYYGKHSSQNITPVRVMLFADGLYVLRAKSACADLLGARVENIEGRPTRDVIAALELLHGGTEGWRRTYAAIYVQSPEILYGDAIGSRPDQTQWTFRLPDGSEVTRTLPGENSGENEPHADMTRWLSPQKMKGEPADWRALISNDADLPLPLRDFNSTFRRAWIDHGCALFIQLKSIADADEQPIADFLSATTEEMRAHPPCHIILDMRFNTGGDYTKAAHFASHLADFLPPSGRIYLLTGPQTFSAAITTTAFVKQAAGPRAIILGEPVGDRLTFYGEGNSGCLPHEDLCLHYATGMHDYARRCDDWDKCFWLNWIFPVQVKSLAPNETIQMSFADYTARRDPVFERAVALAAD